jgi:hypothetical protein
VAKWDKHHNPPARADPNVTEQPPSNPKLRSKLLKMARADQSARLAFAKANMKPGQAMEHVRSVDRSNLESLKKLLHKGGFPDENEVGKKGVKAAFLLVQHASGDLSLQEATLPRLKALYKRGQVAGDSVALLTDRILLDQGKKQVYGTQTRSDGKNLIIAPISDSMRVDARRASLGLMPLSAYKCELSVAYGKKVK